MNKIIRELYRLVDAKQIAYFYRLVLKPKTILIDGLTICSDPKFVPPQLLKSLNKETHEFHERKLVKANIDAQDRVLEIGASSGLVSLVCARICGTGNLLMYEAIPKMEVLIRKNFELNNLVPNLEMKAITSNGKDIDFFVSENVYSSSVFDRSSTLKGKSITVSSCAFGKVLENFRPTALIMDIEGSEVDLLSSFEPGLIRKIIVELHPHIVGCSKIELLVKKLKNRGFVLRETSGKTSYFEMEKQTNV